MSLENCCSITMRLTIDTSPSRLSESDDLNPVCWLMVSRRALAPVATCGEATKPGLTPNGSLNQQSLLRKCASKWHCACAAPLSMGIQSIYLLKNWISSTLNTLLMMSGSRRLRHYFTCFSAQRSNLPSRMVSGIPPSFKIW